MSLLKRNPFLDPLPEYLKGHPLVFVVNWKIPKENHDNMVDYSIGSIGNYGMDTQRMTPGAVAYSRTRHWWRPSDGGVTEEWWFMDEYDSSEAFEAMQQMVKASFIGPDAEARKIRHQALLDLMVPGSSLDPILYSEDEGARIEFEPFKIRKEALDRAERIARENANK
jgi:hypothetical protein